MARSRTANQGAAATNVSSGSAKSELSSVVIETPDGMTNKVFLQIFDNSSPTVGTTVPDIVVPIPAPPVDTILGQNIKGKKKYKVVLAGPKGGLDFSSGLSYAVTTTGNGNTDPAAGDKPTVLVFYQPVSGTFTGQ